MITATRRIQFCAGHRVVRHESKCRNIHGHNYVAFFEAYGVDNDVDRLGRVIDFSVLKEKIGGWIDEHWDHGFIAYSEDVDVIPAIEACLPGQKMFIMQNNPTAENMAKYLLNIVCPMQLLGTGVKVRKVTLWETENCYAEATL